LYNENKIYTKMSNMQMIIMIHANKLNSVYISA